MTSSSYFLKSLPILCCAIALSAQAQTTLRQAGAQRALLMGAAADADEFGEPDPLVLEPLYASTLAPNTACSNLKTR